MSTINKWESDIKLGENLIEDYQKDMRILALIDLVRKKDEEIQAIYNTLFSSSEASRRSDCNHAKLLALKAIALTEQWK